jgi:hypothetical protein
MGTIIPFKIKNIKPKNKTIGHRISFYTDVEIEITLLSLNMFGSDTQRYTIKTLKELDPLYIKSCLCSLKSSDVISSAVKKSINIIIDNMEEIKDANI